mgnify:CR=1 FL=1
MKTIIYCAVTLNGKIAKGQSDSIDWTTKEDKKLFAVETKKAGVVVMGHNTFRSIGQPLKDRLNVVLTSKNKDSENLPGLLEYTSQKPEQILETLKGRGFKKVFVIGGSVINTLFLKENLVDEVWITLAPRIFGYGINLVSDEHLEKKLNLLSVEKLKEDLLLLKYKLA